MFGWSVPKCGFAHLVYTVVVMINLTSHTHTEVQRQGKFREWGSKREEKEGRERRRWVGQGGRECEEKEQRDIWPGYKYKGESLPCALQNRGKKSSSIWLSVQSMETWD